VPFGLKAVVEDCMESERSPLAFFRGKMWRKSNKYQRQLRNSLLIRFSARVALTRKGLRRDDSMTFSTTASYTQKKNLINGRRDSLSN
jgi:hypothetical protein